MSDKVSDEVGSWILNVGALLTLILGLILILMIFCLDGYATHFNYAKGLNQTMINETLRGVDVPSYVQRVDFYRRDYDGLCGWYNFGGTIKINLQFNCDSNFSRIFKHELRHAYWFQKMGYQQRDAYCKSVGYANANSRDCWEHYSREEN